jgi:hypothetical protein
MNRYAGDEARGLSGSYTCQGWMTFATGTLRKIRRHADRGYDIVVGNDWQLAYRPKWSGHECIRLAQTRSRTGGYDVRVVWAVKREDD